MIWEFFFEVDEKIERREEHFQIFSLLMKRLTILAPLRVAAAASCLLNKALDKEAILDEGVI